MHKVIIIVSMTTLLMTCIFAGDVSKEKPSFDPQLLITGEYRKVVLKQRDATIDEMLRVIKSEESTNAFEKLLVPKLSLIIATEIIPPARPATK